MRGDRPHLRTGIAGRELSRHRRQQVQPAAVVADAYRISDASPGTLIQPRGALGTPNGISTIHG
jgi:hypothetical protein